MLGSIIYVISLSTTTQISTPTLHASLHHDKEHASSAPSSSMADCGRGRSERGRGRGGTTAGRGGGWGRGRGGTTAGRENHDRPNMAFTQVARIIATIGQPERLKPRSNARRRNPTVVVLGSVLHFDYVLLYFLPASLHHDKEHASSVPPSSMADRGRGYGRGRGGSRGRGGRWGRVHGGNTVGCENHSRLRARPQPGTRRQPGTRSWRQHCRTREP